MNLLGYNNGPDRPEQPLEPFKDKDKMWFGIHEGKELWQVPANYLMAIYDLSPKGENYQRLLLYIENERKCLQLEVKEELCNVS